jgi:hypothetical protein
MVDKYKRYEKLLDALIDSDEQALLPTTRFCDS